MSKLLLAFAFALLAGLLAFSGDAPVAAQDCERVIPGNTNSPCKRLDYLAGVQAPTLKVGQFTDDQGDYYCRPAFEFQTRQPLDESLLATDDNLALRVYHNESRQFFDNYRFNRGVKLVGGGYGGYYLVLGDSLIWVWGWSVGLTDAVPSAPGNLTGNFILVVAQLDGGDRTYSVWSDVFAIPDSLNDYSLLMNQCLAGISRQLEHEAALEEARQQAEADRIAAETAAEEAANAAEIAAIELQSAQDALAAQESLNAALLQETILAIKREDSIRAAWQQVILVRMAGLEERTRIWTEAVERWAAADLQFSTAMSARIEEVERLQALNAALEQSMSDQRKLLIARLEDLEQAEQAAIDSRTDLPQSAAQTDTAAVSGQ